RLATGLWPSREESLHRLAYTLDSPFAIHPVEGRGVNEQVPPSDELTFYQCFVSSLVESRFLVSLPISDPDGLRHILPGGDKVLVREGRRPCLNVPDRLSNGICKVLLRISGVLQNLFTL